MIMWTLILVHIHSQKEHFDALHLDMYWCLKELNHALLFLLRWNWRIHTYECPFWQGDVFFFWLLNKLETKLRNERKKGGPNLPKDFASYHLHSRQSCYTRNFRWKRRVWLKIHGWLSEGIKLKQTISTLVLLTHNLTWSLMQIFSLVQLILWGFV